MKPYGQALREFRTSYFTDLLAAHKGSVAQVAEIAGMNRCNLYRVLYQLGIYPSRFRDGEKTKITTPAKG